jgi:hypothetical protein
MYVQYVHYCRICRTCRICKSTRQAFAVINQPVSCMGKEEGRKSFPSTFSHPTTTVFGDVHCTVQVCGSVSKQTRTRIVSSRAEQSRAEAGQGRAGQGRAEPTLHCTVLYRSKAYSRQARTLRLPRGPSPCRMQDSGLCITHLQPDLENLVSVWYSLI